jgi:4-hydroxyphenylpyruvate dioxygenase
MRIDHIHFFVEDAIRQREWFIRYMGWKSVRQVTLPDRDLEILSYRDTYFVLSSPRTDDSPVAQYLCNHTAGVVNVAFAVTDLSAMLDHLEGSIKFHDSCIGFANVGNISFPSLQMLPELSEIFDLEDHSPPHAWACVHGWGGVSHTIIERRSLGELVNRSGEPQHDHSVIDHVVLNVPSGELQKAVKFYQNFLGLEIHQNFQIQTERSGLHSQVMYEPEGKFYFNINEPTSANSQIQDFLNINRGAGIQHIALHSEPILKTVTTLQERGLPMLSVPLSYYHQLQNRLQIHQKNHQKSSLQILHEWVQIVEQKILIDWQIDKPESFLLQIFSRPVFPKSHFFFEFIERRQEVKGFGEGNFLALYQAIEADC